jgi:hypothetical protein
MIGNYPRKHTPLSSLIEEQDKEVSHLYFQVKEDKYRQTIIAARRRLNQERNRVPTNH